MFIETVAWTYFSMSWLDLEVHKQSDIFKRIQGDRNIVFVS